MFFVLSKLLWALVAPGNAILLLLALACLLLVRRHVVWGRRLAVAAALALFVGGALPLGNILLLSLENRFPVPALDDGLQPEGIIVLGGAIDQVIGRARGGVAITESATRLTEGAILARRYPKARLIYTGGSNALVAEIGSEADDAKRLWVDLGIAPERILLEDQSRNTYENAQFTRDLVRPGPGRRFILVTSAYHMPRSVGLFRAAGFDVLPMPVDYRTTGTWRDFEPSRDIVGGLAKLSTSSREWIGLVSYRLTGKIADLFPSP